MLAVAPRARFPSAPMAWVALVVTPPLALPERNITPAGRLSVTVTFRAASGPRLVTVMVKVRLLPAKTDVGAAETPMARSLLGSRKNMVGAATVPAGGETVMNP